MSKWETVPEDRRPNIPLRADDLHRCGHRLRRDGDGRPHIGRHNKYAWTLECEACGMEWPFAFINMGDWETAECKGEKP